MHEFHIKTFLLVSSSVSWDYCVLCTVGSIVSGRGMSAGSFLEQRLEIEPSGLSRPKKRTKNFFKAGVHLKAVFWLGIMFLMQISRLRFKQSRIPSLITHIYVWRRFVNFLVIFRFIWR